MIGENTYETFLMEMVKIYARARKAGGCRQVDPRVVRGRAHCVAGYFEDAFADLISKKIFWKKEKRLRVFTDFPITVEPALRKQEKKHKERATYYIDVMVCCDCGEGEFEILYMAELKTNTGWMRGKVKSRLEENQKFANHISLPGTSISVRSESLKDSVLSEAFAKCNFKVSAGLCYDLIVLSGTNIDPDRLSDAAKFNNEKGSLFVLTDDTVGGEHEKNFSPKPRKKDFKELSSRIKRCLNRKGALNGGSFQR